MSIENVEVKEHKGNYGDTKNASANSLYKSYKDYVVGKGQKPLSFQDWIKWAKEKNILPNNFKAEGEEVQETEVEKVAEAVGKSTKVVVTVILVSAALLIAYNLFNQTSDKPKT